MHPCRLSEGFSKRNARKISKVIPIAFATNYLIILYHKDFQPEAESEHGNLQKRIIGYISGDTLQGTSDKSP